MGRKFDFDVIVIGSGIAGSTAAKDLAKAKFKVAVMEGKRWGGSSFNQTTVPLNCLAEASSLLQRARMAQEIGLSSQNLHYNFPTLRNWALMMADEAAGRVKKDFEAEGIECIEAQVRLLSKNEVTDGERVWTAKYIILATGSDVTVGDIAIASDVKYLKPIEVASINSLPENAVIIGGGGTGCEIAQIWSALGVKVTLLETKSSLFAHKDREVGELMREVLERMGIEVRVKAEVKRVSNSAEGILIEYSHDGIPEKSVTESLVICSGNAPNLDLGLENAGLATNFMGIEVNSQMRTSAKNIYACGDIIGGEIMPDRAFWQAKIAAAAISGEEAFLDKPALIHTFYTHPQIAEIGRNEKDCEHKKEKYSVATVNLEEIHKKSAARDEKGFVKILCGKDRRIIGATIVAENAGILMQELSFALFHGFTIDEVACAPHLHFDTSEILRLCAEKLQK